MMSEYNAALFDRLSGQLSSHRGANLVKLQAYEGKRIARVAGVRVTEKLKKLAVRIGWPRTVVDVLEERLDFLGWEGWPGDELATVYEANNLLAEASLVHVDSLIYGVGFALVYTDEDGSVNVSAQSPFTATGVWDGQKRRLTAGLVVRGDQAVMFEPDVTTYLDVSGSMPLVTLTVPNRSGRVPLVMFPNRTRGSRSWGQSEITPMVLDLSDEASRTLLDMAVNRTFHASPQRYVIANVDEDEFQDKTRGWKALTSELWGMNADPNDVKLGEFQGTQPTPFVQELQQLTEMLAAESGIPVNYLGLMASNPASADAIRAGEARLVKRAERHQSIFGASWLEVARLLLMERGVYSADDFAGVHCVWRDAATPTRAAAADEVTKLVGANILPATSSLTLSRLGFTPEQQAVLAAEREQAPADPLSQLADSIGRQSQLA